MIDWKVNLLLLLIIIALYKIYFLINMIPETFINNNTQIENNINQDYSIQNVCTEKNPIVKTPYLKYNHVCINKYIDLDRGLLNVPLYLYPSLNFHPLN